MVTFDEYGEIKEIDFALKNGGGSRDTILGPSITRLTIGAALAFDKQLAVIELNDEQLLATTWPDPSSCVPQGRARRPSRGAFPTRGSQGSCGMRSDCLRPRTEAQSRDSIFLQMSK